MKNFGVKVKSLSFAIFKKYGTATPEPKVVEFVSVGKRTPDLLLTVGSGWENLGK